MTQEDDCEVKDVLDHMESSRRLLFFFDHEVWKDEKEEINELDFILDIDNNDYND